MYTYIYVCGVVGNNESQWGKWHKVKVEEDEFMNITF